MLPQDHKAHKLRAQLMLVWTGSKDNMHYATTLCVGLAFIAQRFKTNKESKKTR